jgi:hypothetical protein
MFKSADYYSGKFITVMAGGLMMAKYSEKAQEEVAKATHEHKHEGKFKSQKQAVAAGLSKARSKGAKVPKS